jgi:hypothetical protein
MTLYFLGRLQQSKLDGNFMEGEINKNIFQIFKQWNTSKNMHVSMLPMHIIQAPRSTSSYRMAFNGIKHYECSYGITQK